MRRILCSVLLLMIPLVSNQPQDHTADLWEAFEIASAEAVKWDASAQPYFITSVDDGIESEAVKGQDGKRHNWNFDFVVENTDKHLIITLHDKTVVSKTEAQSHTNRECIIDIKDLRISTAEAVITAREKYGLLPGKSWAEGYHFVLENHGSQLILSVVGRSEDGAMSRISFDAKTGGAVG